MMLLNDDWSAKLHELHESNQVNNYCSSLNGSAIHKCLDFKLLDLGNSKGI